MFLDPGSKPLLEYQSRTKMIVYQEVWTLIISRGPGLQQQMQSRKSDGRLQTQVISGLVLTFSHVYQVYNEHRKTFILN